MARCGLPKLVWTFLATALLKASGDSSRPFRRLGQPELTCPSGGQKGLLLLQARRELSSSPAPEHKTDGGYCGASIQDRYKNVRSRDRERSVCGKRHLEFRRELRAAVAAQPRRRVSAIADGDGVLPRLRRAAADGQATAAFEAILNLEAQDLFAFKETWTDRDTELLGKLDGRADVWGDGPLTTASVAARLPSLQDLDDLLANRSVAVVGSGSSLAGKGHGAEIDSHAEVVRFNNFPISVDDTGNRTTIVAVNRWVEGKGGSKLFDLEMVGVWDSLCWRLHREGPYSAAAGSASAPLLFVMRPSARCALDRSVDHFTRGFLFYWFVGSLFAEADLYGFHGSGRSHFCAGACAKTPRDVLEPWVLFEHLVYRELHELQTDKRVLALASIAPPAHDLS